MLRPLEQQFEEKTVARISRLIKAFHALDIPVGPCKYYLFEITKALEAGLLLAAVELSASLLELIVRELVARAREQKADAQHEFGPYLGAVARRLDLEYERHLMFHQLLNELENNDTVASKDAALVRQFYRNIRIPLHHGLPGRYVSQSEKSPANDIINVLSSASIHSFEEAFEQRALSELGCVVNFIATYCGNKSSA